jgi:SHS2 domain-containing protein
MRGARLLEHTSDVYIEAFGADLREAFEEAAKAVHATIVKNLDEVRPVETKRVEAEGYDDLSLLYEWLEKNLLLFEIDRFVGGDVKVLQLVRGEQYRVVGMVVGEPFDPKRHQAGIHVKSPTYWLMEVLEGRDGGYVRFVLDI